MSGFYGIDVAGMGELAATLLECDSDLRLRGRTVDAVLRRHGESRAADDLAGELTRVGRWTTERHGDLLWRRDMIANGQAAAALPSRVGGAFDPIYVAQFAVSVGYDPALRDQAYRVWVAGTDPAAAADELWDLGAKIAAWPHDCYNDPVYHDMTKQAAEWRQALAVDLQAVLEAAAAMEEGLSPAEAGLPEWLFPPGYLLDLERYESQIEEIERLEYHLTAIAARLDPLYEIGDPTMAAEVQGYDDSELVEAQTRTLEALGEARDNLTNPAWDTTQVHGYLSTAPLLDWDARQHAAGVYLAEQIEPDGGGIDDLPAITALLDGASGLESQAFYSTLGSEATASLPGMITQSGVDAAQSRAALRVFSESLGDASQRGLDFTGAELVAPDTAGMESWYRQQGDASLLFLYGNFADDFIVPAALYPLEHPEEFSAGWFAGDDGWHFGDRVFDLVEPELFEDGRLSDVRTMLFGSIAQQGPGTSAAFVVAAQQLGLIDDFLYPESVIDGSDLADGRWVYDDHGVHAGAIIAELGAETDAARIVVEAIATGGSTAVGIAAGAEIMFAQNLTALIQEESADGLATPQSPLADITPADLDGFLKALFLSGTGAILQVQAENLVGAELEIEMKTNPEGAYDRISYLKRLPLGELIGRIEAARITSGAEMAAQADQLNGVRATISGILAGAGVSLLLPASTLLPVAIAVGAATDGGAEALATRLFPQNHLAFFWAHEYMALVDREPELQTAMLQMLIDAGMVEESEWSDYTDVKGHDLREWGNLLEDIYNRADWEVEDASGAR